MLATASRPNWGACLSEPDNVDRASQFEQLRFAKGQQWYVATAAVTLLSAIFWIERSIRLVRLEKIFVTFCIGLIAGFGICFLVKLQNHLKEVRLTLGYPNDLNPWWRGVDVLSVLIGVVALAALVVLYFLWTHHISAAGGAANQTTLWLSETSVVVTSAASPRW